MVETVNTVNEPKKKRSLERGSNIFYALLMIFPVAQFILFYLVVNFKSFGYAFMEGTILNESRIEWSFTLKNISEWFTNAYLRTRLLDTAKMSLVFYGIMLLVSIPLGLLFAYYIFKKLPLSGFFRIFLFVPSIIPAAAFVMAYKYILNDAFPVITEQLGAKMPVFKGANWSFDAHPFGYILFYNLYISFGTSVLMYANKMFDISPEIVEAGKLDGAVGIKEFWHIILPLTFPTLSVFLVTGIATLFTNHYNLFMFYVGPEFDTLGYYLYKEVGTTAPPYGSEVDTPPIAALGLILTAIAIPLTFGLKAVLDKFGPSED
ncbi:MAG: sugar ABC transporter permease [Clostridia bacterium]|nr:sugar ABC transporter permease [Clostridia bacterium]